jgi:DNA-binding beta-propeller fold protein YncE
MNRISKISCSLLALAAIVFFASCDPNDPPTPPVGSAGFFVVNEGAFNNSNASLSFYDRQTEAITNNLFATANNRPLGDQAQSMTIWERYGYIVVQNSQKVEVIDINTLKTTATITEGIASPRYFVGVNAQKGYLSDWGADGLSGTVKVIDLQQNRVTKSIAVGRGPNRMSLVGTELFVTNNGGFGNDNTISVIDITSDAVKRTLTTADNPNSIVRDQTGNLWLTCSGKLVFDNNFQLVPAQSTPGALVKLDATGRELLRLPVDRVSFSGPNQLNLSPDGNTIYFTYQGGVWAMGIGATSLPTAPLIAKAFYGLAVDPLTSNIIGCVAPNFSSSGSIEFYTPTGQLQRSFSVGIGPNSCTFK